MRNLLDRRLTNTPADDVHRWFSASPIRGPDPTRGRASEPHSHPIAQLCLALGGDLEPPLRGLGVGLFVGGALAEHRPIAADGLAQRYALGLRLCVPDLDVELLLQLRACRSLSGVFAVLVSGLNHHYLIVLGIDTP